MLRAFKVVPPSASDRAPCRRRRRCIPSLGESASSLEDRVLLSGAGHGAPAADVARPLAETAAGQHVTALFQSILHTDPTGQQLTHWVHAPAQRRRRQHPAQGPHGRGGARIEPAGVGPHDRRDGWQPVGVGVGGGGQDRPLRHGRDPGEPDELGGRVTGPQRAADSGRDELHGES